MISNDLEIWLVDAFTNVAFSGNPAGICLVDSFPDIDLMQKIAAELNWSETAFVQQKGPSHFHIRWFSPQDEAPICGHATLSAAHILWQERKNLGDVITFESLSGPLTAEKNESWITLNFPAYPVYPCALPPLLREAFGDVPIQSVHTDSIVLLVVLNEAEDVANLAPNLGFIAELPYRSVIVTARAKTPIDFVSRYFAPKVGIPEDPVCGSSHCRLIPYWKSVLQKDHFLAKTVSHRGGTLRLTFQGDRVTISGQAITVSKGKVFLHKNG